MHGPPPQVLWVTLGNTSNAAMKGVLSRTLSRALDLLAGGEPLVEITDAE
jgi:predicted nuclease of predicted toxin-antitoxin system